MNTDERFVSQLGNAFAKAEAKLNRTRATKVIIRPHGHQLPPRDITLVDTVLDVHDDNTVSVFKNRCRMAISPGTRYKSLAVAKRALVARGAQIQDYRSKT